MKILHVTVESDDGWLIGQGLEAPEVITQARTLDELLANVRDAAAEFFSDKALHIEMILPPSIPAKRRLRNGGKLRHIPA